MSNEAKGMLLGFLGVVCFGMTLPVTSFVISYLDPIFIGLGRAVIASFLAAIFLILNKTKFPSKFQLYQLFLVSVGLVVGFPVMVALAMQTVPASHGGVVLGVMPLTTAFIGTVVSNEKPSLFFWIFGILGSIIVVIFSLLQETDSFLKGDFYLLGAILFGGIGYAMGGKLSKEIGGWQVICWALIISLPFIIVPVYISAPNKPFFDLPVSVIISFLYLGLVSQFFGFFLWNKGLALGGIARVSQTMLFQPFVTLFASSIIISEYISNETIMFALLVFITVGIGKKMPIYEK